jgi:hypothetical protein
MRFQQIHQSIYRAPMPLAEPQPGIAHGLSVKRATGVRHLVKIGLGVGEHRGFPDKKRLVPQFLCPEGAFYSAIALGETRNLLDGFRVAEHHES